MGLAYSDLFADFDKWQCITVAEVQESPSV
jgi:hypothetical protein